MRQTICQECGAPNKAEAVVCSSCGVQLDHAENRLFNRLKEQGVFSRIASAPFRLVRWILKKIKLVLSVVAVVLVLGGGFILFLIFAPMGWPDYSDIPQSDATHKEAAKALAAMKRDENPVAFTPDSACVVANQLLFPPTKTAGGNAKANGKEAPEPEKVNGRAAVEKYGDNRFEFALTGRIYGKVRWRLSAIFQGNREKEGNFEIERFRLGNLAIPQSLMRPLAIRILRTLNPEEELSAWLARVRGGRMQLRQGQNEHFTLTFAEDGK